MRFLYDLVLATIATYLCLLHPVIAQLNLDTASSLLLNSSRLSDSTKAFATNNYTIEHFAAIGDSYATGVGSGKRLNKWCSRYDHAYPYIVNAESKNGTKKERNKNFDFFACCGATTDTVKRHQMKKLKGNIDAMTLTIGGNDVGFQRISNDCIFGWFPKPLKKCAKTLAKSQGKLKRFATSVDSLIVKAVSKLTPETGRLYITGYAQMFDGETPQCDSVSFAFFNAKKTLIQERRRILNKLALDLNQVIEDAAKKAGAQVVYVDIDSYFSLCRGRVCEAGVSEPDTGRKATLFYEKFRHVPDSRPDRVIESTSRPRGLAHFVSDKVLRTFHPRSNGHRLIADLVLWHMAAERAKREDVEAPPKPGSEICPMVAVDDVDDQLVDQLNGHHVEVDGSFEE